MSSLHFIFTIFMISMFEMVKLQDTGDCGKTLACFRYPTDCVNENCIFIFKWIDDGLNTNFSIAVNAKSILNKYVAIGFSNDDQMNDDNACICKSSDSSVQHYYNNNYSPSLLANPNVGLTNVNVLTNANWLMCSFTRVKMVNNVKNYFDLNNNFFILAVWGDISGKSLEQHKLTATSSNLIDFKQTNNIGSERNYDKVKTHGCLMTIAWMLLASTGILIARYYKFIVPEKKFFGLQLWFVLHRPMMLLVPLVSIVALIVILAEQKWTWVTINEPLEFSHSIFGIVAIGLSVIQPLIALCRCDKDHKHRNIFNYVHRTFGLLALLCSIVALFLGVVINKVFLKDLGWGIMVGFTLWVIFLTISLEINILILDTYRLDGKGKVYQINEDDKITRKKKSETIKVVLLILHIIITLAFTLALIVFIGKASPLDVKG